MRTRRRQNVTYCCSSEPPQPPLLVEPRHPEAPPGGERPLPAALRRRPRSRDRGDPDHRRQGGLLPPHVGAAVARRRRPRALALVPDPHLGAAVRRRRHPRGAPRHRPAGSDQDFFDGLQEAYEYSWPKPRVIVMSFPHNPTTTCVDLDFFQRVVDFAREREVVLVHDNAYADLGYDGYSPPSILQAEGAKEVAVELYSMTKSFSMAGWRVAFLRRQRRGRRRAGQAQVATSTTARSSPSRSRPPSPSTRRPSTPSWSTRSTRAAATRSAAASTASAGTLEPPKGTMFVWAPIPEPYREMGSIEFAVLPGQGGPGRGLARRRVRPRRRRPRALRPHRERAAHQPGACATSGRALTKLE